MTPICSTKYKGVGQSPIRNNPPWTMSRSVVVPFQFLLRYIANTWTIQLSIIISQITQSETLPIDGGFIIGPSRTSYFEPQAFVFASVLNGASRWSALGDSWYMWTGGNIILRSMPRFGGIGRKKLRKIHRFYRQGSICIFCPHFIESESPSVSTPVQVN